MMTRTEFQKLEEVYNEAFQTLLRCECKNRLSRKGCQHAQATNQAREIWYAAHPLIGLVRPDAR